MMKNPNTLLLLTVLTLAMLCLAADAKPRHKPLPTQAPAVVINDDYPVTVTPAIIYTTPTATTAVPPTAVLPSWPTVWPVTLNSTAAPAAVYHTTSSPPVTYTIISPAVYSSPASFYSPANVSAGACANGSCGAATSTSARRFGFRR
jgi:hypothetical protein